MTSKYNQHYEQPAYGLSEAAVYLKVPYNTLRYWLTGFKKMTPIIAPVGADPVRLSFLNLLECQVLAGMRGIYDLKIPKVRSALRKLSEEYPQPHPLISQDFLTDGKDLFIEKLGRTINISRHGQLDLESTIFISNESKSIPRACFGSFRSWCIRCFRTQVD